MTTLTCPKCQGEMRQYERNGVTVDQCNDCRGIFLDRGELERLVDSESRWTEQASRDPRSEHRPPPQQYDPRRSGHKKRKHWIEELFD